MTYLNVSRHGDTIGTREKRYQGTTDVPLSPSGKKKFRDLAPIVRGFKPDVLYTSALTRCKESGEIITRGTRLMLVEDARLNEIGFGRWEGKTAAELLEKKDPVYLKWAQGRWGVPPGGESLASLKNRVGQFLNDCLKRHGGGKIVVVAHAGTIRMTLNVLLKFPLKYIFFFRLDPASVTILRHDEDWTQAVCLNNTFFKKGWRPDGF
jgi:alpha-ribazole phosphatase/probable phosphoglycerate mutase